MRRTVLALALVALVGSCRVAVQSTPRSAQASSPVSTLVEMVRQRPLDLAELRPLLGGTFSGDSVRLSTTRVAPLSPGTLVESFDEWRFAARLQLLMDFASWQLAQNQPRAYGGHLAAKQRRLDEQADLRIATLARETGYDEAWRPFIAVYAEFHREVSEKALEYRSRTGDEDPFNMMHAIEIDQIARSHLEGVIEEFPIDPQIVAHEMLRLLEMTREMLGVSGSEALDRHLFHACGMGKDSKLITNAGHPLAAVLSLAYQADSNDAAANEIRRSYRDLVSGYESWALRHSTASLEDQLGRIRTLTKRLRIVQQLENYREVEPSVGGPGLVETVH